MKKAIIIILLALLGMTQAIAQEYEYVPFVREGVKWVYHHVHDEFYGEIPGMANGDVEATLELKGDTVIDGKTYKAMHKYHGDAINTENDTIVIYLREEDKIVYGIVPNGCVYPDCKIDWGSLVNDMVLNKIREGEEFVLYNFKDPQHYYEEMLETATKDGFLSYIYTDTVTIGNRQALCHLFHAFGGGKHTNAVIEGIGFVGFRGYTLSYWDGDPMAGPYFYMAQVIENGENILPPVFDFTEYPDYTESDVMKFGSDGLKWINERVTVSNGDTTCMYYSYEFRPQYIFLFDNYYTCHYHEYGNMDANDDSVVCDLYERYFVSPRFIGNKAFAAVAAQDRNMIDFTVNNAGGQFLYIQFSDGIVNEDGYYIARQREPFLNQENFVEIEPLLIDGKECSRYAYLGEDGEPLAYVVEGIGFDSYDMGDLLTPFTRKPDPNADYQEWCGLCHVVKDGRVIYKGMRYTPDNMTGIDEVVADQRPRHYDGNYYDLTGRCMGTEVPTTPGIYIHNGNKICVSRMQ